MFSKIAVWFCIFLAIIVAIIPDIFLSIIESQKLTEIIRHQQYQKRRQIDTNVPSYESPHDTSQDEIRVFNFPKNNTPSKLGNEKIELDNMTSKARYTNNDSYDSSTFLF